MPQAVLAADPDQNSLVEKRRNIVKVFDVKDQDMLLVDNQFGQVKINLWAKKEIKVEIVITANAPTDGRAAEYLSAVAIDEKREKNRINLTTVISKNQLSSNSWNNRRGEKNFIQIDYTVFMPKENALFVKNKFGNTDIPTFQAPLTINTKNGNFSAVSLKNPDNNIDVRYGTAKIGKMDGGKLESHYSNITLEQVTKLLLNNKFGELSIGDVTDLNADIDYSGVKIGTIRGVGKIKLNYSDNFKIGVLTNSTENVDIQAAYSSVVLPADANRFNVTVTYGNFSYPSTNVNFSQQPSKEERTDKVRQYQGKIGTGSGTKITIVSKFGDVKIKD
ncbi:hypothetical protein E0F88_22590 [Dyadobacter psychrotolerans]|uniref:Adhesin domain-containing protein n=1 Tax=Dyadobacter psychrotolerans TaxID=2541721 RepID=A0A4R5DH38_9BACT|nr:hypothetical protein E0F88_22590 [Dyadobacter psychrotolerans]